LDNGAIITFWTNSDSISCGINDTLDEDFLINGTTKIFKDYFQYNDKKIKFDEIETFNITTVKSDSRGTYLEIVLKLTNGEYLHDDKLYETISGSDEKLKWRFLYLYLYDYRFLYLFLYPFLFIKIGLFLSSYYGYNINISVCSYTLDIILLTIAFLYALSITLYELK